MHQKTAIAIRRHGGLAGSHPRTVRLNDKVRDWASK